LQIALQLQYGYQRVSFTIENIVILQKISHYILKIYSEQQHDDTIYSCRYENMMWKHPRYIDPELVHGDASKLLQRIPK